MAYAFDFRDRVERGPWQMAQGPLIEQMDLLTAQLAGQTNGAYPFDARTELRGLWATAQEPLVNQLRRLAVLINTQTGKALSLPDASELQTGIWEQAQPALVKYLDVLYAQLNAA